jgi:flagellar biosynthesis protein FliR
VEQYESILEHVPAAMLAVFRTGGLMIYGPVFGSMLIPVRVRVFLALLIGLAIYPLLPESYAAPTLAELSLWMLPGLILLEVMLGLAVGFMASIPLASAQTGGLIMGQQMGLGFAKFYNPAIDGEADVMGQLFFFMALAGFLMIGGHEAMLLAVLHSFTHVPAGALAVDGHLPALIGGLLLAGFEMALRVAAPLLAIIFLQSIAMGFVSKTVPQLNILSLGFPMRILMGLFIILAGLVIIDEVMMESMDAAIGSIFAWIEAM